MSTSDAKPILTSVLLVVTLIGLAGLFILVKNTLQISDSNKVSTQNQTETIPESGTGNSEASNTATRQLSVTDSVDSKASTEFVTTTDDALIIEPTIDTESTVAEIESNQPLPTDLQPQADPTQSEVENEVNDAATVRSSTFVEVPKSFALKDAAKYFVPKEERAPGNLGGPPPFTEEMLSIMEQSSPAGFAPPPAPGTNQ